MATMTHRNGSMETATEAMLPGLLLELREADDEYPDVAVSDESGWTLSVFQGGGVVWENVEEDEEPRHMRAVEVDEILELLRLLVHGKVSAVEARRWQPGHLERP